MQRKHYLDNIRSLTVILVLIYHAFYIFNGVGVMAAFENTDGVCFFDGFCTFVYPWFMVLLFCIAGIAARHSVKKRGNRRFIKERARKLMVPSTLGVFILHWITGYLNIMLGGGLSTIPTALVYPISVLSGIGPLWFAQTVFLYSLFVLLISKFESNERLNCWCENSSSVLLILLGLFIFMGAQVLNVPVISVYRFGIYGVAFFIGYFFLYFDKVIEKTVKLLPLTFTVSLILGCIYMWMYFGKNYASDEVLKSLVTNLYAWFAVLAIIGTGKKWLDKTNKAMQYLNKASFGIYVLHFPVVMVLGYLLTEYTKLSVAFKGIIVLALGMILTLALNYIVEKIPFIRYCLLGIEKRKNEI